MSVDIGDRIGHGAAAEGCGQTGHGRSVSGTGTVVDVVCAHHRPCEFLDEVILLVGAPGRTQCRKRIGAVLFLDLFELAGNQIDGLVPGGLLEPPSFLISGLVRRR